MKHVSLWHMEIQTGMYIEEKETIETAEATHPSSVSNGKC